MQGKIRPRFQSDLRNGIGCRKAGDKMYGTPEYCPGFHKLGKGLNKNGLVGGSNWGFCKATQSTRDDARVFGRDMALLWRIEPSIPEVVLCCVEYLEKRAASAGKGLFSTNQNRGEACAAVTTFEDDSEKKKRQQQKDIRRIRARVDRAQIHMIDWNAIEDPHVVGNLLMEFLSDVEPPLMTYVEHRGAPWSTVEHRGAP